MSKKAKEDATYVCHNCGGVFEYEDDWTDDDAWDEFRTNFPQARPANACVICDDCYQIFIKRSRSKL